MPITGKALHPVNPKPVARNSKQPSMPYIGSRVKRKEDLRLLRGIGKYVGDIQRPGMVHAVILRSTYAHARVVNINATSALKLPGVIGVLSAADMPGIKTIPMRTGVITG